MITLSDEPINPDKYAWQKQQIARDFELEKRREKDAKARLRRARTAQRQLKKTRRQLEDLGEITDWEENFIASVDQRLDKYGAAFQDREKGGTADALSVRQKQVLSQMRRKIKDKGQQALGREKRAPKKWGSRIKNKSGFKPRVRHIEDDMIEDIACAKPQPVKRKPKLTIISGGKK
ncbi:MAG: hypothetical protein V3U57_09800 [Robiginitomaculum sp.]